MESVPFYTSNFDLSFPQTKLWLASLRPERSVAYNNITVMQLDGELDITKFKASLGKVVELHDALRATFPGHLGNVEQRISSETPVDIDQVISIDAAPEQLEHLIDKLCLKPFNLAEGPLFRFGLIQTGPKTHYFILVIHHIIADGYSFVIFLNDLFAFYHNNRKLIKPTVSYRKTVTDNMPLNQEQLTQQENFWKDELKNGRERLTLPYDNPEAPADSFNSTHKVFSIPAGQTNRIKKYAAAKKSTPFVFLLSVFKVFLSKVARQQNITTGITLAGRNVSLEKHIGMYVTTPPVRSNLNPNLLFEDYLKQLTAKVLKVYKYQNYPVEEHLNDAQSRPEGTQRPLYDAMFLFRQKVGLLSAEGLAVTLIEYRKKRVPFNLVLEVIEENEDYEFKFQYNTDLFSAETIESFCAGVSAVLNNVLSTSAIKIGDIQLLDETGQAALLAMAQSTQQEYPVDANIVNLFEDQVQLHAALTAVVYGNTSLTYLQLNQKANQLAHYLQQTGAKPETIVPICVNRGPEMIIAILGVLKAGAAYVPIDPAYPQERIAYMLNDVKATTIISTSNVVNQLSDMHTVRIIELDTHEDLIAQQNSDNLKLAITPRRLAYVIYTSGSTGRPKGVMIEHAGLANLLFNQREKLPLYPGLSILQTASFSFDASCFESFASLINGGKLIITTKNDLLDLESFHSILQKNRVKMAFLPASYQSVILDQPFEVETVVSGGETPNANVVRQLQQKGINVFNVYGPTENTVATTITGTPLDEKGRVIIGKPLNNVQVYLADENGKLVPKGIVGEILIGGAQIGRGYLNHPELTDQKFISNPFNTVDNSKIYRSGDLGRWLPNGNLEFMGRLDEQVKIRGHRIELGEIEAVVNNSGLVKQAAVIALPNETGEKTLMGYAVGNGSFNSQAIITFLKERLPEIMVPEIWTELDAMPLDPNDKVDKKALPTYTYRHIPKTTQTPETAEQILMASIWEDLLGLQEISLDSDFFELGGNSLKIIKLASEIHKKINVKIALNDFFSNTRLAEQALLIKQTRKSAFSAIPKVGLQPYYELSPSQQRLWIIHKLGINRTSYNSFGVYETRLQPDFNVDLFNQAVNHLIERHETLRTIFIEIDGHPRQQVLPTPGLVFQTTVLKQAEAVTYSYIYNIEFRLDTWPLFKLYLVKENDGYRLLYMFHHIITDGWSLKNFFDECWAVYQSLQRNMKPQLAQLPVQYKDYAAWQNQLLTEGAYNQQRDYWITQLSGNLPKLQLPYDYDFDDEAVIAPEANYYEFYLTREQQQSIKKFIAGQKISLFSFFIGCFKILLGRLTGQTDIITGTPVANRTHDDIKGLLGFFLNTLMLRDNIDESKEAATFLQKVNATLINALENQNYPFEKLLDELNIKKSFNSFPISTVFLNLLNFDEVKDKLLPNLTPIHSDEVHPSKFDLECFFEEYQNGIKVVFTYRTSLLKPATAEAWMEGFVKLVTEVLENADTQIKDLKIFGVPSKKRRQPTPDNNFTFFQDEEIDQSIISRFEKQVERYPGNIAISQDNITITYEQLAHRVNGLASELTQIDGLTHAPIALLLEHGAPGVIGILGALKTGNTYVPIDVAMPQFRMEYILNDAGCKAIIASASSMNMALTLQTNLPGLIVVNLDATNPLAAFEKPFISDLRSAAYILYTSGSTGQPKGVMQSHRNVLHFIRVFTNNLKISSEDRISLLPTYSFDSAVMDIYGALLNGAALCPYNIKDKGLNRLAQWLDKEHISIIHTVPTVYRSFINELTADAQFKNIRLVVLGGEAVYKLDFDNFKRHFSPGAIFINGYGPTESTITLQNFFDHYSQVNRRAVAIGYPVAATAVYLLDKHDQPLTYSYQAGEIVYKSDFLALGYLNDPQQTAKAFTVDPVTQAGRVYRSGDFGRLLPTGEIEFIGRKDSQVKMQGVRIELVEIEHALRAFEPVTDCLVIMKESTPPGNERIVAYYTADEELSTLQIRKHLNQLLPTSFLPALFIRIDKIPKTASGKSNRRALEDLPVNVLFANQHVPPSSPTEKLIAKVWSQVLKVSKVGLNDDFFSLGGNSLMMIKVMNELQQQTGFPFTIKDFVNQSLASTAQKYDQETAKTVSSINP